MKNIFHSASFEIRFLVPVERVETTIFNSRVESRCFNPLHSYSQSDSQKSCFCKTKHSECNSCDCSPRFARAAKFTLMQSLCFAPCNVIYYFLTLKFCLELDFDFWLDDFVDWLLLINFDFDLIFCLKAKQK